MLRKLAGYAIIGSVFSSFIVGMFYKWGIYPIIMIVYGVIAFTLLNVGMFLVDDQNETRER